MPFDSSHAPAIPFPGFKWRWATLTCTESINDPVVLLGVLGRMRRLEGYAYSSPEFALALSGLEEDLSDSVGVHLSARSGARNLIRNSGQYWRALGLIPDSSHGVIELTDLGRLVADHQISQTEFSAATVLSLELPNVHVESSDECDEWQAHGIRLRPLRLLLEIVLRLYDHDQVEAYLTPEELTKVIMPLSGDHATLHDYADCILRYRRGTLDVGYWPDCCVGANDKRMAREFLLFLNHYGYLPSADYAGNRNSRFVLNLAILDQIRQLLGQPSEAPLSSTLDDLRSEGIPADIVRQRVMASRLARPGQTRFRRAVLNAYNTRCAITGAQLPSVLEASHIKPVEYNGSDSKANGLCLRIDIHVLFDTGHLQIRPDGTVLLSPEALQDYGSVIPAHIVLPPFLEPDFLRWRLENYYGI